MCVVVVVIVFVLAFLNQMEQGRRMPILGKSLFLKSDFIQYLCYIIGAMVSFIFGDRQKLGKHSPLLKNKGSGPVTEKQMAFEEIVLGKRIGKGSYGEVFLGTWRGTEVGMYIFYVFFSLCGGGEGK